jgi:hypothetical protein
MARCRSDFAPVIAVSTRHFVYRSQCCHYRQSNNQRNTQWTSGAPPPGPTAAPGSGLRCCQVGPTHAHGVDPAGLGQASTRQARARAGQDPLGPGGARAGSAEHRRPGPWAGLAGVGSGEAGRWAHRVRGRVDPAQARGGPERRGRRSRRGLTGPAVSAGEPGARLPQIAPPHAILSGLGAKTTRSLPYPPAPVGPQPAYCGATPR